MPDIPLIDKTAGRYPVNLFYLPEWQDGNPAVVGTPGSKTYLDFSTPTTEMRGAIVANGKLYVVLGTKLYEVSTAPAPTLRGTLDSSTGRVFMEDNGSQLMIVDDDTDGYIYTYSGSSFAAITDEDFPGAAGLTYQDGYFIINAPNTENVWISALPESGGGTSWSTLDVTPAQNKPDDVLAVLSDHQQVLALGSISGQMAYNSGNADFPFTWRRDIHLAVGIGAVKTLKSSFAGPIWMDQNFQFRLLAGGMAQVISTPELTRQITRYDNKSNAFAFVYTYLGQEIYQVTFPTANHRNAAGTVIQGSTTWCCNLTQGFLWHALASYPHTAPAPYSRHRANCYAFFNNKHIIGDYSTGKLLELDPLTYADLGSTYIHREWYSRPVFAKRFNWLRLGFKPGVGLAEGDGSDPQADLYYSDDGGESWSSKREGSIGQSGENTTEVTWTRLGAPRNPYLGRIFKVVLEDPVELVLRWAQYG